MTASHTYQDPATAVGEATPTGAMFDDPVAYLASFGIESELVGAATMPAAA